MEGNNAEPRWDGLRAGRFHSQFVTPPQNDQGSLTRQTKRLISPLGFFHGSVWEGAHSETLLTVMLKVDQSDFSCNSCRLPIGVRVRH